MSTTRQGSIEGSVDLTLTFIFVLRLTDSPGQAAVLEVLPAGFSSVGGGRCSGKKCEILRRDKMIDQSDTWENLFET